MGLPSSLTPTIPASFIAAISASASPLLPTDAAPIGHTRTLPAAAARSTIPRVTDALSFTGCVFGMQQTAVNPPRAAARVPVSIVSDISWPGSRRWQCRSMKPGATTSPVASKISRIGRRKICADLRDSFAIEQDVERRVGLARRIEHSPVLNQQHSIVPSRDEARPPARRR